MDKPKNRRARFSRGDRSPPQSEATHEIPRGSKREIRRLIEDEGARSTTEIANSLNEDRYPCATAERWSAKLVDSALRAQDMGDLKDRIRDNRGEPEPVSHGASILEIKQAMDDTIRDAFRDYGGGAQKLDTFALKGAMADAVTASMASFRTEMVDVQDAASEEVTSAIKLMVKQSMLDGDIPGLHRITRATGQNVAEIGKKLDDTCDALYDCTVETLKEHSKTVVDACENMALTLTDQVDKRVDALSSKIMERLDTNFDEALERVVDARLKLHLDAVVNQFAAMVGDMKRELLGQPMKRGKR